MNTLTDLPISRLWGNFLVGFWTLVPANQRPLRQVDKRMHICPFCMVSTILNRPQGVHLWYPFLCVMSLWRHTYPMTSHRAMFWHGWTTETPLSSAFPSTSSIDSSRWWTLLLGWCFFFLRRGTTISSHSSDNCTARRRRSESSSRLPSLFTSVGSGQRHRTSSKNYASRQTFWGSTSSAVSLIIITGCSPYADVPSAIVLFWSLPHAFGTVCRRTSRLHPRCLFFAVVLRHSDTPLQTLLSVTPSSVFCCACEVTCHNLTR